MCRRSNPTSAQPDPALAVAMHKRYPVPAQRCRVEEEIQKSRFITTAAAAASVAEAQAFVASLREEFPDATHHCWAYLVGPPGSSGHVGMSDDGEPRGTAGRPMLTVLSHCGVGDIVCVVTRFYGGTKLGTGGLVRAYSGGVQLVLQQLARCEKVLYRRLSLVLPYPYISALRMAGERAEVRYRAELYETDVTYELDVPEDTLDLFLTEVGNLSGGSAIWEFLP